MNAISDDIVFRPSGMPGMRRWRFELSSTHLTLRNMRTWMPVPPFLIQWAPDIVIPLNGVAKAEVDPDPIISIRRFSKMKGRGLIPGLHPLTVCTLDHGHQFFAVRGGRPALAVDLHGQEHERLTVTFPDPALMVERIRASA